MFPTIGSRANRSRNRFSNISVFSQNTSAVSRPQILLEPLGTTPAAWGTSYVGIGFNAALSTFAGTFISFRAAGTEVLAIKGGGNNSATIGIQGPSGSCTIGLGSASASPLCGLYPGDANTWGLITNNSNYTVRIRRGDLSDGGISVHGMITITGTHNTFGDVVMNRDAAAIFALRNGTTAQSQRLYSTWTDASNGAWLEMSAGVTASTAIIGTNGNGTGAATLATLQFNILAAKAAVLTANGFGYGTGQGGTVTQATSKSTGVTLNKVCGQITMNAATLIGTGTGNGLVSFTLTNSTIAANDVVQVSIKSGATANAYNIAVIATAAGSCVIQLHNAGFADLAEAVVLNFVVFKGVSS